MIGLAYSMGGLGAITASAPVEIALRHFSWREIFTAFGAAALALCLVFALVVPEHPNARQPPGLREGLRGLSRIARRRRFLEGRPGDRHEPVRGRVPLHALDHHLAARRRGLRSRRRGAGARLAAAAMIAGYLLFGRLADRLPGAGAPSCRSSPPAWSAALCCLAFLALGVAGAAVPLWAGFCSAAPAATLAHSIVTRRYPRDMAGRVNTALNTFTFLGIFLGQWGTGVVLGLWPQTAAGYDPRGYFVRARRAVAGAARRPGVALARPRACSKKMSR